MFLREILLDSQRIGVFRAYFLGEHNALLFLGRFVDPGVEILAFGHVGRIVAH
jgi:hypothetical protein